jgi:hypothetical protein
MLFYGIKFKSPPPKNTKFPSWGNFKRILCFKIKIINVYRFSSEHSPLSKKIFVILKQSSGIFILGIVRLVLALLANYNKNVEEVCMVLSMVYIGIFSLLYSLCMVLSMVYIGIFSLLYFRLR